MILDSCFLIDFLNNKKEAVEKYDELKKRQEELFITTVSVFEITQGISKHHEQEKIDKIRDFLKSISCYYFDFESAQIAGEIMKELREKGKQTDVGDAMIGGIALAHNQTILTRNTKHFERIKNIKTETY